MSVSLDPYRAKLIIKILYADSVEAVERYTETAIHALKNRNVNGYIIARFIAKVIHQLDIIFPAATESQMNNIKRAKSCLHAWADPVTFPAG